MATYTKESPKRPQVSSASHSGGKSPLRLFDSFTRQGWRLEESEQHRCLRYIPWPLPGSLYCAFSMLRQGRRLLSNGVTRSATEGTLSAQLAERLVSGALASSSGTSASVQAFAGSYPRALQSLAKAFSSIAKRSGTAPEQLYRELQKVGACLLLGSTAHKESNELCCQAHRLTGGYFLQVDGFAYTAGRRLFSSEPPPRKGKPTGEVLSC